MKQVTQQLNSDSWSSKHNPFDQSKDLSCRRIVLTSWSHPLNMGLICHEGSECDFKNGHLGFRGLFDRDFDTYKVVESDVWVGVIGWCEEDSVRIDEVSWLGFDH